MKEPFRTIVEPELLKVRMGYQTPALFLGSCFTTSIGEKMRNLKFPVMINPSGVLYNPASIKRTLDRILDEEPFTEEDLYFDKGLWFSLVHDTSFSDEDTEACLEKINRHHRASVDFLRKTRFLFLTFGTAWVYVWKQSGRVVANCHKLPAALFERRMLGAEEIVDSYRHLTDRLFSVHPDLQIVCTVSPIRHWKDGPYGNQYSKSVLHVAIHKLLEENKRLHYFPSYEIMMDDLRDYRFYAADMLHLSPVAVNYIWGKFRHAVIDPGTFPVMREVEKILQAVAHRPYRPDSVEYRKFREEQLKKMDDLGKKYPFLDFTGERNFFERTD